MFEEYPVYGSNDNIFGEDVKCERVQADKNKMRKFFAKEFAKDCAKEAAIGVIEVAAISAICAIGCAIVRR